MMQVTRAHTAAQISMVRIENDQISIQLAPPRLAGLVRGTSFTGPLFEMCELAYGKEPDSVLLLPRPRSPPLCSTLPSLSPRRA